jgi:hypothetical protein
LAAVNVGKMENGLIFTIGIVVPTLVAMRALVSAFRVLAEGSRIYDSSDVWPMVASCVEGGERLRALKQGRSGPRSSTRPNGSAGNGHRGRGLRRRAASRDVIRENCERTRLAAARVFPGEERVFAVRDSAFETLERRGELTLLQDVCRVTGVGLLRVYPDGVCKWSVVPG